GVHSALCSLARSASSISLSLAVDTAPARSIRSFRLRVVSQVHGVKPGHGNANRSTPSKGSPSGTPTATSIPRPEMSVSAGATTCIARHPDGSPPDSSTTGRRSSNSAHQTSPRRMCPPGTSAVERDLGRAGAGDGAATVWSYRFVMTREDRLVAAGLSVDPAGGWAYLTRCWPGPPGLGL